MSLATVISFPDPRRYPPLLRLSEGVKRPDVRKVMGRAIATDLRKHFTKLDQERPNQLGGRRTHFYGQVRRGVQQPELVAGDGVRVDINHVGIAQRYYGGRIKRADGGLLTIPVHPEAHGKRAREFDDLYAVYFDDGSGLLARPNADSRSDAIGEVYYRLVHEVEQKEDPTVLPPEKQLQQAALDAGEDYLRILIQRANS